MWMSPPVIAIDGPSGAGKGTVARAIARALGCRYVDTGAMYRAVAWKARTEGVALDDEAAVAALAARVELELNDRHVVVDRRDVTQTIRTPEIDVAAAAVARVPKVRRVLVARQREYASAGPLVMEGRDIGTTVFPDADVKLYLDAQPNERARRRAEDPAHRGGQETPVAEVATALEARDHLDRTRRASPLTKAPDATFIDTTGVPVEEVVRQVMAIVKDTLRGRGE